MIRNKIALAVVLLFGISARASALSVSIGSTFVHQNNKYCMVNTANGVTRFYCPPLSSQLFNVGQLQPPLTPNTPSLDPWADASQIGKGSTIMLPNTSEMYITGNSVTLLPAAPATSTIVGSGIGSVNEISLPGFNTCELQMWHSSFTVMTTGSSSATLYLNGTQVNSGVTPGSPVTFSTSASLQQLTIYMQYPVGTQFGFGNISNQPNLEFDAASSIVSCHGTPAISGTIPSNYCNASLYLCASIEFNATDTSSTVQIDKLTFDIFKYQAGSNPLDPASTPPLQTLSIQHPGFMPPASDSNPPGGSDPSGVGPLGPYCELWDGSYNIGGQFGKTNGQFGFRATVETNENGAGGNVTITNTISYPAGATYDGNDAIVEDKPITVDVTNIHSVVSSPTIVGTPGVAAEPINIQFRLSKDANVIVNITTFTFSGTISSFTTVRILASTMSLPGEGVPNGTLTNGIAWNGRFDNGDMAPPGMYQAVIGANGSNSFGNDPAVQQLLPNNIAFDPLQITNLSIQPLVGSATSLATIGYMLTEPAVVYVDIYSSNTYFCRSLNADLNTSIPDTTLSTGPAKDFGPTFQGRACGDKSDLPLREIVQQQQSRAVNTFAYWDGRDNYGNLLPDGNYIFVMYAYLPSQNGYAYGSPANPTDKRIWTTKAQSGYINVTRGLVGISQILPATSVIGSSPTVFGLDPFTFTYQVSRPANVTLGIYDITGRNLIKTIIANQTRQAGVTNAEIWYGGTNNDGYPVSSGTYLAQLTVSDPAFPGGVSTTTAQFPVDLYRITDVPAILPALLNNGSEVIPFNFQLSQSMNVAWNIYPPGTIVVDSGTWPPCADQNPPGACGTSPLVHDQSGAPAKPIFTQVNFVAGRYKNTWTWDGKYPASGLFVPDGQYVFTLVAQASATFGPSQPPIYADDHIHGVLTVARGAVLITTFTVTPDAPTLYNSSGTSNNNLDPFIIDYALSRQSSVTIQILNANPPFSAVRTLISAAVRQGGTLIQDIWDGRDNNGELPVCTTPGGCQYTVQLVAQDLLGSLSSPSTAHLTIVYNPVQIYDEAIASINGESSGAQIAYQLSEPMKVAIKIYQPYTPSNVLNSFSDTPSSPYLVKRIIGMRPARTQIKDIWDGTNLQMSMVQDGNYRFKIIASTDPNAIDNITGNPVQGALLADGSNIPLVDAISVTRGPSANPAADFTNNTFIYPNPVPSSQNATINIYLPFQGRVIMSIYTIAGNMVLQHDFGEQPASYNNGPLIYPWDRVNQADKKLARGVYFILFRAEQTLGGTTVLQTVKKVMLQ